MRECNDATWAFPHHLKCSTIILQFIIHHHYILCSQDCTANALVSTWAEKNQTTPSARTHLNGVIQSFQKIDELGKVVLGHSDLFPKIMMICRDELIEGDLTARAAFQQLDEFSAEDGELIRQRWAAAALDFWEDNNNNWSLDDLLFLAIWKTFAIISSTLTLTFVSVPSEIFPAASSTARQLNARQARDQMLQRDAIFVYVRGFLEVDGVTIYQAAKGKKTCRSLLVYLFQLVVYDAHLASGNFPPWQDRRAGILFLNISNDMWTFGNESVCCCCVPFLACSVQYGGSWAIWNEGQIEILLFAVQVKAQHNHNNNNWQYLYLSVSKPSICINQSNNYS